ncbi:hypothetical protein D3C75_1142760 [compost metagenome]
MVVGDVVVGEVVAALIVHLADAHAPGSVLADNAVGVQVIGVAAQQAGLFDLVAGLAIGDTGEGCVGGLGCSTGAEKGDGEEQGVERFHKVYSWLICRSGVGARVSKPS